MEQWGPGRGIRSLVENMDFGILIAEHSNLPSALLSRVNMEAWLPDLEIYPGE